MGGCGGRNGCDVMEEIQVFLKDIDTALKHRKVEEV
jgi:hypothetical protein